VAYLQDGLSNCTGLVEYLEELQQKRMQREGHLWSTASFADLGHSNCDLLQNNFATRIHPH